MPGLGKYIETENRKEVTMGYNGECLLMNMEFHVEVMKCGIRSW